ncbi:MAG: ATP-binding protein, partial [Pseudoflavonifractor sp.]
ELRYATAVKVANINIWEYVYATDELEVFSKSSRVDSKGNLVKKYAQSAVGEKHIREDCAQLLLKTIGEMKRGAQEKTVDLWMRLTAEEEYWCERVTCTNLFSEDGVPLKAYCVGHDVTREKEAEKRYRDELSYRQAMQKATIASVNMSLTENRILDYKSSIPELVARMKAVQTAQGYFDLVYTQLTTPELQERCGAMFSRDALLRHFAAGETTLSMDLTRRIAGRSYQTVMTVHMTKKPENNEVVAIVYSRDVTGERTMQSIMDAVVKTDYDFLVVVDALKNTAVRYSENGQSTGYALESGDFEGETQRYARSAVIGAEAERVAGELTLKNILHHLEDHETYNIFYKTRDPDGNTRQKQLRFSYISRREQSLLMTRVDITPAVEEQERKNRALTEAVEMAERANAAKSEFLSRISHEIRTPMNAIIGMSQIALQSMEHPEKAKESIEKSLYAAQYLLLLLNDILDMSRIESGKVTLKNGVIHCNQCLTAIATIIEAQAQTKGVRYEVKEFEGRREYYLGDGVRLQQILINILSNAVKFTPAGGLVQLDIAQTSADEKRAKLCFKITDTGIGVGADFLPHIFEPFAQEHSGSTSSYGGSGLGLAISKNLAQLMGGDIFVESTRGQGTVFTVELTLGIGAEGTTDDCGAEEVQTEYDFSGRRILLVEDHQLNIMVARRLLEFKNASVVVAENGALGLDLFAKAPEHTYDLVLMDIRMPVMDGLQAARAIRNLKGPWAKQVPIVAMSANAYEEDVAKSRAAGMNAHLAKPIDADLLYRTIDGFLPKKGEPENGRNA